MEMPKGKRHTIYLDAESVLLTQHLKMTDETFGGFIQRMIKLRNARKLTVFQSK